MSVIKEVDQSADIVASILSEFDNINIQRLQKQKIYEDCLKKYQHHLNKETEQLEATEKQAEAKNQIIRHAFIGVYDTISDGTDCALRAIRRTQQCKKQFWQQTIKDLNYLNDIQLKKQLYQFKNEAYDKYLDAIDERKANKFMPYLRMVSQQKLPLSLYQCQRTNRQFEGKVMQGTLTMNKWNHLEKDDRNKENNVDNYYNAKEERLVKMPQQPSILTQFYRK